jgi:hypothetical protein
MKATKRNRYGLRDAMQSCSFPAWAASFLPRSPVDFIRAAISCGPCAGCSARGVSASRLRQRQRPAVRHGRPRPDDHNAAIAGLEAEARLDKAALVFVRLVLIRGRLYPPINIAVKRVAPLLICLREKCRSWAVRQPLLIGNPGP